MANKKSTIATQLEDDTMPETDVSKDFVNFFLDELKSIYWSEKHLGKIYTKMKKVATYVILKDSLADHCTTAQTHSDRLEQVFELLGESPKANKSDAIYGISEEINVILSETEKGSIMRDTAMVLAAQKLENYEISTYANIIQLARKMGNEDIISLLEENSSEQEKAHEIFSSVAESILTDTQSKRQAVKQKEVKEEVIAVYDSINLTNKIKN